MPRKPTTPTWNNQLAWYMAHLRVAIHLGEGSGSSTPLTKSRGGTNFDAGAISTDGALAWATDAEGPYLDGSAGDYYVWTPTAGASFSRYTIVMRFRTPAVLPGASKPVLFTSANTTVGALKIIISATNTLSITNEQGGTDYACQYNLLAATDYTLIIACNGTTTTVNLSGDDTPDTVAATNYLPDAGLSVRLDYLSLNRNHGSGALGVIDPRVCYFFDECLDAADLDEFLADPYLPLRGKVAECATETNPVIGDVTDTTISLGITRSHDASATRYFRTGVAATAAGLASPTYATAQGGNSPRERLTFTHTGLTAHTTYYAIAEWSTDGSTWYRFPGGPMRITTAPDAGATSTVFSVVFATDSHTGHTVPAAGGTPDDDLGYGLDTLYEADGSERASGGVSRTNLCGGITVSDISRDETPAFLITGGDIEFTGSHEVAGNTDDICEEMWDAVRKVRSFLNPMYRRCGMELAIEGNHEPVAGNEQKDENGTALQKQTRLALKAVRYGPYGTGALPLATWTTAAARADAAYMAAYVTDAGDENTDPLKSYWTKRWGPAVFIGLDVFACSNLGVQDGVIDGPNWTLGAMMQYLRQQLVANAAAAWKFVVIHHGPGGGYNTSNGWYGRNGFTNFLDPDYWAAYGATAPPEIQQFLDLCRAHGVTAVLMGHDHKAAHYVIETVNICFCPSMGAQSVSGDATSWHTSDYVAMFGTADLYGADLVKPHVEVKTYLSKCGYTRIEIDGSTSATLKFVTTTEGLASNKLPSRGVARQVGASAADVISDPGGTTLTLPTAARRVSQVLTTAGVTALTGTDWGGAATDYIDTDVAADAAWFDKPSTVTWTLNADPNSDVKANYFPRAEYSAALTNAQPIPGGPILAARAGAAETGRRTAGGGNPARGRRP